MNENSNNPAAAAENPAQEAAPQQERRGDGEALLAGVMVEAPCTDAEWTEYGHSLPPGTKLYAAPPAAQASHENALEGIAQAAAALDVLGRKPLAAWLMRIHAGMAQASDTPPKTEGAEKDGERYRWLRDHRFDFIARNNGSKPQLHLPAGALPLNDAGVDALIDAAREATQDRGGTP